MTAWLPRGTVFPFTADGEFTMPAWATFVRIICLGGGGGGGSGGKGAAGTLRSGGGGGPSGGYSVADYVVSDLPSTLYVTVGEGNDGGASVTANSTAGNPATTIPLSGHYASTFVSDAIGDPAGCYCRGGAGGALGSAGGGTIGVGAAAAGGVGGEGVEPGTAGAAATSGMGAQGVRAGYSASGGSGGGLDASNVASHGGPGWWPMVIYQRGGYALWNTVDGDDGPNPFPNSPMGGGSGAGGTASTTGDAGAGGMGGYGGGGGGGGAATNAVGNSGAGGKGGSGICWIIVW